MKIATKKIATAASTEPTVEGAVAELKERLGELDTALVICFASSQYDQDRLSASLGEAFPGATVIGCSSSGEIAEGEMRQGSLAAMAFDRSALKSANVQVIEGISTGAGPEAALAAFESQLGESPRAWDLERFVGLVLVDGLSRGEERLMDRLGDLTDVLFVGGSAGDDVAFVQTSVYANGRAYTDAAVLALLEPTDGYDLIKTQSFRALEQRLVVTKADEATRTVLEFNGKPALVAYAEAVGVAPEQAAEQFMRHPVGLPVGGEIFVRSPQQVSGDAIVFYCNMVEGMELSLLESTDIVGDTRAALAGKVGDGSSMAGLLNFNCILRTLELQQKSLTGDYGRLFADMPAIGLSTYGEQYLGHINQTATMVVFK